MIQVLLALHLVVALLLIGMVMLQKSEGGALGIGGGGAGGSLFSARGVGNTLTRATAILAACFFATSIALTMLANRTSQSSVVVNQVPAQQQDGAPAEAPSRLPNLPTAPQVPTNQ